MASATFRAQEQVEFCIYSELLLCSSSSSPQDSSVSLASREEFQPSSTVLSSDMAKLALWLAFLPPLLGANLPGGWRTWSARSSEWPSLSDIALVYASVRVTLVASVDATSPCKGGLSSLRWLTSGCSVSDGVVDSNKAVAAANISRRNASSCSLTTSALSSMLQRRGGDPQGARLFSQPANR